MEGVIDAIDASVAAKKLREQGLFPQDVTPVKGQGTTETGSGSRSKESFVVRLLPPVKLRDRLQLWRQLHSLSHAGISLSEALAQLSSTTTGYLKRILLDASVRTSHGEMLSEVLSDYPATIPAAEVAFIKAGEAAGRLEDSIGALADMNEREVVARRELIGQLVYPCMVLIGLLLVPLIPTVVLGSPDDAILYLRLHYLPKAICIAAIIMVLRVSLLTVPVFAFVWDRGKITFPIIGALITKLAAAKVARIIAGAYRSGLGMAEAVNMAADSCGNTALAKQLRIAVPHIRNGEAVTIALAAAKALPPRAMQLMATGEKTGDIDQMMLKVEEYFNDESKSTIKTLSIASGVLLLLIAALFVGQYVISGGQNLANQYKNLAQ